VLGWAPDWGVMKLLVDSICVVIVDVLAEQPSKVVFVQDDYVIE
jgi:hypothetical protein